MSILERAMEELRGKGVVVDVGRDHDYEAAKRAYFIDRGCTQKKRYPEERVAIQALMALKKRTGRRQRFDAYECPHCHGWHVAKSLPR